MDSQKIHALGCDVAGERLSAIIARINRIKSLAAPLVCLPDMHMKDRTEGPSSFAAATTGTIVPDLTAPSVGCGMGVLATSLFAKDMDHNFYEKFYALMKTELGPRYGRIKNLFLWLGFFKRPRKKYDLSVSEFENIIRRGAAGALERYGLPKNFLEQIDNGGSEFSKDEQASLNLKSILPRISYRSGRHDIGYGFKGNHFLEIQYVEEIIDAGAASKLGIRQNQVIVMYHGGGGAVSYHIGRYFANRKKNTFAQKIVLGIFKFFFHFGSISGIKNAPARFRYYFNPRPFQEIPLNSPEGKRLMDATRASQNYSYGFRMAMVRRIIDSLDAAAGKNAEARLVWDGIHNLVREETIGGKKMIVHRHTANRVSAGKPVAVSGFNTTSSYIAIGAQGAEKYLNSSDHGAGVTIKRMLGEGVIKQHPRKLFTHIYQTKPPFKRVERHVTNDGIDFVVETLRSNGIISPVARLRPLAVFKG